MASRTDTLSAARAPLTKERVIQAAVELADAGGIEALSMRKLGQALGVEAMSLYNHAANKDEILDGIADAVIAEIEMVPAGDGWTSQLRDQIALARQVLLRHPWAPRIIEARPDAGPGALRYMEHIIGILRQGGFSLDLTHHAIHVLGSRIFGFTQELFDQMSDERPNPEVAAIMAREMARTFPYITELATSVSHEGGLGGCDDDVEFFFALDLILDGLERLRDAA
jgi:AcrR family transcriptional regulator